jgi:hypothetical protein
MIGVDQPERQSLGVHARPVGANAAVFASPMQAHS